MSRGKEPGIDEREWEIQERGMRAARGRGTVATPADPTAERYRQVAEALISAPRSEPPPDFAAGVVRQIPDRDAGVERALLRALILLLTAASVATIALYGIGWWRAMREALTGGAMQWLMAAAGCAALSWIIGQVQSLHGNGAMEERS